MSYLLWLAGLGHLSSRSAIWTVLVKLYCPVILPKLELAGVVLAAANCG